MIAAKMAASSMQCSQSSATAGCMHGSLVSGRASGECLYALKRLGLLGSCADGYVNVTIHIQSGAGA